MILPSLNAFNCGDILRVITTIPSSNETANRKSVMDWTIRRQAILKKIEASTTTKSSLSPFKDMVKFARMGRFILLAWFFVFASAFFVSVVEANMGLNGHQGKIFNPIVRLIPVDVMNNLRGFKDAPDMFFHDEPMKPNISLTVSMGMVRHGNHSVSVMCSDESFMVEVNDFKTVRESNICNMVRSYSENFSYLFGGHIGIGHLFNHINRDCGAIDSRNTEASHAAQYNRLTHSIPFGNFYRGLQFFIIPAKLFGSDKELFLEHENNIAPYPLISQEGKIKYSLNYQETDRGQDKEPTNNIMEIKGEGSKVIITTIPDVAITDYKKGEDTSTKWQNLSSPGVELVIDRAKMFAFKMDKIDIKQFAVKMMPKASDDAAQQMKIVIDADGLGNVYADAAAANKGLTAGKKSSSYNLGASGSPVVITKSNILDYIIDCESVADEQNWPDSDRWIVIPTWMSGMIMKSDLKDASLTGDSTSIIRGGRIGQIGKWSIYVTNQYTIISDGGSCYPVTFGHKSGLTFASQLVETEYFDKLESTFGSGMKGLNVYGFKVIKSEAIGYLYCKKG